MNSDKYCWYHFFFEEFFVSFFIQQNETKISIHLFCIGYYVLHQRKVQTGLLWIDSGVINLLLYVCSENIYLLLESDYIAQT